MKYAITGPKGAIFNIVDAEPTDAPHYSEISDADAATVEASEDRFFIVDGVLLTQEEFRAAKQQERYEAQITEFGADIDGAKAFVRDHLASKRYDFEVDGIDVNGLAVRTDRFTVERVYQARFLAKEDPGFDTDWKLGDGTFLTIDATTIISISDAVTAHLKEVFTKEKTANTSIDASTTLAELQAITW